MKDLLRGAGISTIIIGALINFYPLLMSSENESTIAQQQKLQKENKTLQTKLKTVENQLAELQVNLDKATAKKDEETAETSTVPEQTINTEETINSVILKIQPGMSSIKLCELLESVGIIQNREEFLQYLKDRDLVKKLQVGTYKLTSEMTMDQIANVITK